MLLTLLKETNQLIIEDMNGDAPVFDEDRFFRFVDIYVGY